MMNKEKLEANEKREEIFKECNYICQVCKNPLRLGVPQLAHKIAKTKCAIKKYGEIIINHKLNLVPVCSLYCNSKCNIGNNPVKREELVQKIKEALLKETKR